MKQSWECHASLQTVPRLILGGGRGGRSPERRSSFYMFGNLQGPPGKLVDFFFLFSFSANKTFDLLKSVADKPEYKPAQSAFFKEGEAGTY